MSIQITVVNDGNNKAVEVDTIQADYTDPRHVKPYVSQTDIIEPGKYKEFYLHATQYFGVREKRE